MRHARLFILTSLFAVATVLAGDPPAAEKVMAAAETKAAAENKVIFVHFGASWCGWCRKLEKFMEAPEIAPILDKHFVMVSLDVLEHDPKKMGLQNAGGEELMKKLGGENKGLPFFAFLDAKGELIINSNLSAANHGNDMSVGYPAEPQEVEWFTGMLRKAVPSITDGEIKTLTAYLQRKD